MKVVGDILECRQILSDWRESHQKIAFVPTMGNLHAGQISLVEQARSIADRVVVSIFVNPLQFGPSEDLATYPRTLQADLEKLVAVSTDVVFTPTEKMLYPEGREQQTRVTVPLITAELCGASRPQFFSGIATVVTKLFNLVQPHYAIFGQKDFQQCLVIRQLIRDLNLPIEMKMAPTVREADGLAMSSRNQYLSSAERQLAAELYRTLVHIVEHLKLGDSEKDYSQLSQSLCQAARLSLQNKGFSVDYLTVRHNQRLSLPTPKDSLDDLIVLGAAMLGKTRLIDNLFVSTEGDKEIPA